MHREFNTKLCALMIFCAAARAENHWSGSSSPLGDETLNVLEEEANLESNGETGFNYRVALEELNQQVREGKLPPEAVAQILESISPILERLDQKGEQIQDLSASSTDENSVKLVVKTYSMENTETAPKRSGSSLQSLPPIAKEQAAPTAPNTGNATAGASSSPSPGVAISIGTPPFVGSSSTAARWDANEMWSKKDSAYNSPKKDSIRVRAEAGGMGGAANSNASSGSANDGSPSGPWASLSDLVNGTSLKTKSKSVRSNGEIKRLVASAVTSFKKRDVEGREIASAEEGSSALKPPKLSESSSLLKMPTESLEVQKAQASEIASQRPDLIGWIFGSLISLLSIRAWFQWRRSLRS